MVLGTLGASLLGNLLTGKGAIATIQVGEANMPERDRIRASKDTIRAGEGTIRASLDYQNEPKFNGVYSRNNLPKIKDGAYVINLDEFKSIGTHWIALYVNGNNIFW